jgi:hypothetical protein
VLGAQFGRLEEAEAKHPGVAWVFVEVAGTGDLPRTAAETDFRGFLMLAGTDRIEDDWNAWPERLVLLDGQGRVSFDFGNGMPGGWDWKEVDDRIGQLER